MQLLLDYLLKTTFKLFQMIQVIHFVFQQVTLEKTVTICH